MVDCTVRKKYLFPPSLPSPPSHLLRVTSCQETGDRKAGWEMSNKTNQEAGRLVVMPKSSRYRPQPTTFVGQTILSFLNQSDITYKVYTEYSTNFFKKRLNFLTFTKIKTVQNQYI